MVQSPVNGPKWILSCTQRHSSTFNGCSGAVHIAQRHSCVLNSIQGMFNTHSTLNSIQGVFKLAQRCSCTLNCIQGLFNSHTNAVCLMVTQWWVPFNNDLMAFITISRCSHSLNGIPEHSMCVQGLFPCTYWHSCALNVCSGVVHNHSKAFMCTH